MFSFDRGYAPSDAAQSLLYTTPIGALNCRADVHRASRSIGTDAHARAGGSRGCPRLTPKVKPYRDETDQTRGKPGPEALAREERANHDPDRGERQQVDGLSDHVIGRARHAQRSTTMVGSSTSRSTSPNMLSPSTVSATATPGTSRGPGCDVEIVARGLDHQPPGRRRRLRAEPEEGEPGLGEDREGHRDRRLHDHRRHDVGQHVQPDDAPVRGALRARRLDIGQLRPPSASRRARCAPDKARRRRRWRGWCWAGSVPARPRWSAPAAAPESSAACRPAASARDRSSRRNSPPSRRSAGRSRCSAPPPRSRSPARCARRAARARAGRGPSWSVPSGCSSEGGRRRASTLIWVLSSSGRPAATTIAITANSAHQRQADQALGRDAARASPHCSPMRGSRRRVDHVDDQIGQHHHGGDHEHGRLDQRNVAVEQRLVGQPAHAGVVEQALDHDDRAEQIAELQAGHRHHRRRSRCAARGGRSPHPRSAPWRGRRG